MTLKRKRKAICKKPFVWLGGICLVLAMAAIAYAHAAVLWAYVENDRVYVEAFFMGGAKIQNQRIVVVDGAGKKLLEGKTDKKGEFSFDPPMKDTMKILLLIDEAHGADFELTSEDFQDGADSK